MSSLKIFQTLDLIENRINNLEKNMENLIGKMDQSLAIQRNHLIRIKNSEEISDEMILHSSPYNDLPPHQAFKIYNNPDLDFMIIDVSHKGYNPIHDLVGTVQIPLEELIPRMAEIKSKTVPIMVISETGIRSIRACEELVKQGFYNINNISGGYKFWPAGQEKLPNLPPAP